MASRSESSEDFLVAKGVKWSIRPASVAGPIVRHHEEKPTVNSRKSSRNEISIDDDLPWVIQSANSLGRFSE